MRTRLTVKPVPRHGYELALDGVPVARGGAIPTDDGGYHLWANILAPGHLVTITRAAKRYLETLRGTGFVCTCREGRDERWLLLLGFHAAERLENYGGLGPVIVYRRTP